MAYSEQSGWDGAVSNDAGFRAWVQSIFDALTNAGLVQTSDTGQIDPTTVARPAINTDAGSALFRFNDSDQASNPVYLKLTFGSASILGRIRITLSTGTGSDGSGNLSNASSTALFTQSGSGSAGNGYTVASHFGGELFLFFTMNSTGGSSSYRTMFMLGRLKDGANAAMANGVIFQRMTNVAPQVRISGAWSGYLARDTEPSNVVDGGAAVMGHAGVSYPSYPSRGVIAVPPTGVSAGENGSVDWPDGVARSYKRTPTASDICFGSTGILAFRTA